MSLHWTHTLATLALQHLWHAALTLLVSLLVVRCARPGAEARSWLFCLAFALAALSPLLVLRPGAAMTTTTAAATAPVTAASLVTAPTFAVAPVTRHAPSSAGPRPVLYALAGVWLLGSAWQLLGLARGWHAARRLHRGAWPDARLQALVADALPRGAQVAVSDAVPGPMVVGLRAPRILVPARLATTLEASALRDLLLHEAAHLHRRDLWISTVQRVVLALYWWSPLQRMLGARLDLAREMACDVRAASRCGGGQAFAHSLMAAVTRLQPVRHTALAVGMSAGRSGLGQRIDGLLASPAAPASGARRVGLAALCVAALAAQVGVTVAATPRLGKPAAPAPVVERSAPARASSPTPLLEAAASGDVAAVRALVAAGLPVDARQPGEGTALIVAARQGDLAMVEALLALGAQPDVTSRGDGNPLIAAAARRHLPVVARLLQAGADVNRIVPLDETPLINAARSGDVQVVAYLVEHGADVNLGVTADFGRWRSPLNQARNDGVRDYLLQHGAQAGRR